jgi:hypothetical protein
MNPTTDTAATPAADNTDDHARIVAAGFDSYVEEVADRRHQLTTKGVLTAAGRLTDSARASMDPDLADLVDLVFSGGTPVIEDEAAPHDSPDEATPVLAVPHDDAATPDAAPTTPAAAATLDAAALAPLPPQEALEALKDQYPTNSPEGNGTPASQQGEGQ